MLRQKFITRFLMGNKYASALNVAGIIVGLTASMIIIGIVYQEYNYDSTIPNAKNLYRVIHRTENGWDYSTVKPLASTVTTNLPEIQKAFRYYPWYGYLACNTEEKKFTEKNVIFTDSSFVRMLALPMLYGDEESVRLNENSVLLSRSGAMRYFGKRNPIGKDLVIGKEKLFTVTGVYQDFPQNSNFKGDVILDISIIHKLTQVYFPNDWNHNSEFSTFVAIQENVDLHELADKVQKLHLQNSSEKIGEYAFQSIKDIHINTEIVWESVSQINIYYLYLLISVAVIIFVMSIANFNILYITTSLTRGTGALVKIVFGASQWRLFSEYLREIILIQTFALFSSGILLMLYNEFLADAFQYLPKLNFAKEYLVLYGLLTILLIVCSLFPAFWLTSKKRIRSILQMQSDSLQQTRVTNYLVATQFALCTLLIFSALVIQKQSKFLSSYDIGYASDKLITVPLNMHIGDGIYNEGLDVFCDEIRNYTGVKNITLGFSSPALVQTSRDEADWEGKPIHSKVCFGWNAVYYDYFETIGIEVVNGRSFNRNFMNDFDYDHSFANYILNQKAVEEMGIKDPVGKSFSQYGFKGQIVGVVEDFHFSSLHEDIYPMAFSMNPFYFNEIIIRVSSSDKLVLDHIKNTWNKFLPNKSLEVNYVSDQLKSNYKAEQNLASLVSIFTAIAIFIATLGLITSTMSSTQKRVKEIGIRKVNGASALQVLMMFIMKFMKWIAFGFVLVTPLANYIMMKWLGNFAYRTDLDIRIFVLSGIIVFLLVVATVSLHSYKAAMNNPVDALRHD